MTAEETTAAVETALTGEPAVTVTAGRLHRGSLGAAGYDLFATEPVTLLPGQRRTVPTGVRLRLSESIVGLVRDRSGLAARFGVTVLAGVLDSDYRGEVGVVLLNTGPDAVAVPAGDRVAQLLFVPVSHDIAVEDSAVVTGGGVRGSGGFGSTGG